MSIRENSLDEQEEMRWDFAVLRELRKQKGLSIAELSEQSGVTASVISKLERNQNRAELETVYRLARVFGLTLSDLMALAEKRTAHLVHSEEYVNEDFHFDRVSYGNMRCMHAMAPKGARLSKPSLHRDDYELCWVLNGMMKITLPNESYQLRKGDSLQFDALLPHIYEAQDDSEIIIIHLKKGKRF